MKSLNWGIIGLGAIASDFAKALREVNGTVYAAGSRNLDKAKKFAKELHVDKAYGSYEELCKMRMSILSTLPLRIPITMNI